MFGAHKSQPMEFLMRALIRLGLLIALALLTPARAQADPQDITLTCVRQNHEFSLKIGLGRFTAIHFIPHADQSAASVAREYFAKADSVDPEKVIPAMSQVEHQAPQGHVNISGENNHNSMFRAARG